MGNSTENFIIQSISKVFVYGMALEDCGKKALWEKVEVEPTDDPFDSVIRLDENSKRPDNPMGAVLLKRRYCEKQVQKIKPKDKEDRWKIKAKTTEDALPSKRTI